MWKNDGLRERQVLRYYKKGAEKGVKGVDINLSPAGGVPPPPLPRRPHGGLECVENSADGVAQTKHTLYWQVMDGVSCHSHRSRQRRPHGNEMCRRLSAATCSGRSGESSSG